MTDGEDGRERWGSRLSFILVCCGSAIGYGNIWRFPALVYQYGGGAFFIPYGLALFLIGIPLLVLEITIGQYYQQGHMGAFGSINKRLRGVGLTSVLNAWFVVTYYCALIAWTLNSFILSFGDLSESWGSGVGSAYTFFENEVIGMSTLTDNQFPTRIVWQNAIGLVVGWLCVFLSIGFGVKVEGQLAYFTMGLPIIMLFGFLVRSVMLPGSEIGTTAYLGKFDLSVLTEKPDVWSTAVSQIFFSIGVTFGVMTAFGSHCDQKEPAFANAVIISLCNSAYSVVSGYAVFAALGYLSQLEGVPLDELPFAGPGLLFGSYPIVLSTIPGGAWWVRLLFFTLFLLGIDSAFALTEGILTTVCDTQALGGLPRWANTLLICFISSIVGIIYVTDAGFIFLDVVDFYVNFMMILVGFFQVFAVGWVVGLDKQIERLGVAAPLVFMFGTILSWGGASYFWFSWEVDAMKTGFIVLGGGYGVMIVSLIVLLCSIKSSTPSKSWGSLLYDLIFRNVDDFVDELSSVVGFIPYAWGRVIKHFSTPILLVLFINLAFTKTDEGKLTFGNYAGLPDYPYQYIGMGTVALSVAVAVLGALIPDIFSSCVKAEDSTQNDEYFDEVTSTTGEKFEYDKEGTENINVFVSHD